MEDDKYSDVIICIILNLVCERIARLLPETTGLGLEMEKAN